MKSRAVILLLCLFMFFLSSKASDLSIKLCDGLSWISGGDFNRNIQGWRNYYSDHNTSPYSSSYRMEKLQGLLESRVEFIYSISSKFCLGVGLEFLTKKISGEISWSFSQNESYFNSPYDFSDVSVEEESFQEPRFTLQTLPVIVTFYYSLPLGRGLILSLGAGGGYYFGWLNYREVYQYRFDYVEEKTVDSNALTDVDEFSTSGEYSEKSTSHSLGFHGGGSLEIRLTSSLSFIFEALGRWVDFKGWKGERIDSYTWEHTWGLYGQNYDSGSEEEVKEGKLWMIDYQCDETGNSYPRLIFSKERPVSSSFVNVREGKINFNGLSIRVGFMIRI